MPKSDQSDENEKPISPTEMFVRSFDASRAEPDRSAEKGHAEQSLWPPRSLPSGTLQPNPAAAPAEPPGLSSGEFTRLFVRPTPSGEHERLTALPDAPPPYTATSSVTRTTPPRVSSPPVPSSGPENSSQGFPPSSSSASTASPSQYFYREIARTQASQTNGAESLHGPSYGRTEEQSGYGSADLSASSEVEELRRSLSEGSHSYPDRHRDDRSWTEDWLRERPSQQTARQPQEFATASSPAAEGVTVLLDRLALEEARTSLSKTPTSVPPVSPMERAVAPVIQPVGPGAFTRVIDRLEMAATAPGKPPIISQNSPSAATPMPPPQGVPATPPVIHMPVASVAIPVAPRIELPKIPAAPPPVLAAPKSKLQEMLPLLLIANAFLMILLIVVVVFALRARN